MNTVQFEFADRIIVKCHCRIFIIDVGSALLTTLCLKDIINETLFSTLIAIPIVVGR
jgi:hypothetical protein